MNMLVSKVEVPVKFETVNNAEQFKSNKKRLSPQIEQLHLHITSNLSFLAAL